MLLEPILIIGHIIGTSLGVGGASVSDFLFFSILRKGEISSDEFRTLQRVSSIVWIGLIIIFLSGFGFVLWYRIQGFDLILEPMFWAKWIVILVIFFNGLFMHQAVTPVLESHIDKKLFSPTFIKKSQLIFSTGAISMVSWYSALILGVGLTEGTYFTFTEVILVYLALLIVAVICSNLIAGIFIKKSRKK